MKPRIYRWAGWWWVDCKHGNPTGPYVSRRGAFHAARDIWVEPSSEAGPDGR